MYSSAHRRQGNLDVEGPLAHFTKTWGGGGSGAVSRVILLYLTYELKRMVAGPGCYIAVIDLLKPSKLRILGCYVVITKKNEPGFYLDVWDGDM